MGIELERALRSYLARNVYLDSITVEYQSLKKYFHRLDKGDKISSILKDYVVQNLIGKTFSVDVPSDIGGYETKKVKIYKNLATKPFVVINTLPNEKMRDVAKKMLIALAHTDEILRKGTKTRFVKADPTHTDKNNKPKHAGAKFVYSLHNVYGEDGHKFPVIAEMMFPTSGADQLYHMNVKGSSTFHNRVTKLKGEFVVKKDSVEFSASQG